jgi:NAD(P)-dependent dehydrogenase (short-subunit alcohol dehydrogenase family)
MATDSAATDGAATEQTPADRRGVLLITGAGRGIGAATARLAARRGYAVCVNFRRDSESAHAVVRDIESAGGLAVPVRADVSQEAEVERLFATVDRELGTLTALVNNVGVLERQCRLDELTADRLQRVLSTNVTGYFLCAKQAVLRMSTRYGGSGGAIVNVSSGAARSGSPNEYVDYAASKGAVDTLTIGLSKEVGPEGIRVNCLVPGGIQTDLLRNYWRRLAGEQGVTWEEIRDKGARSTALRRIATPEEIANVALFLASDESSAITGQSIVADCGAQMPG